MSFLIGEKNGKWYIITNGGAHDLGLQQRRPTRMAGTFQFVVLLKSDNRPGLESSACGNGLDSAAHLRAFR